MMGYGVLKAGGRFFRIKNQTKDKTRQKKKEKKNNTQREEKIIKKRQPKLHLDNINSFESHKLTNKTILSRHWRRL